MTKMLKFHKKRGQKITCRKCGKTAHNNEWGSVMTMAGKEKLQCPFCGNEGPYRTMKKLPRGWK